MKDFMHEDVKVYDAEMLIISKYKLSALMLHSKNRKAVLVVARAILMTYFHQKLGYSKSHAGQYFGRNHSTCIHAINLIKSEPKLKAVYEENFGTINFE